jgi:hypothetical protein
MRERMQAKAQQAENRDAPVRPLSLAQAQRRKRETPARFEMYRVPEVARFFAVSPQTIRRWFAGRATVTGKRYRTMLISRQDIEDWLAEHHGRR